MSLIAKLKLPQHEYDDDGCCIYCGFDGADHHWQQTVLRAEIGDDEFNHRRATGEFISICRKHPEA